MIRRAIRNNLGEGAVVEHARNPYGTRSPITIPDPSTRLRIVKPRLDRLQGRDRERDEPQHAHKCVADPTWRIA
jgi:hypothetical protein